MEIVSQNYKKRKEVDTYKQIEICLVFILYIFKTIYILWVEGRQIENLIQ